MMKIFLQLTFKQLIIQIDNKDIIITYEFTIKNNVSPNERITPTILNILDDIMGKVRKLLHKGDRKFCNGNIRLANFGCQPPYILLTILVHY